MMDDDDNRETKKRVFVVVLGDIGRSPRMSFHALSLAKEGFLVDVIGYGGSVPSQLLLENRNVLLHTMSEVPTGLPKFLRYVCKVIVPFLCLLIKMVILPTPSIVLCQNPPAIPTLMVVWLFCRLKSCKMIIDWHNYGYTILGLTLKEGHPAWKFAKWFEGYFGRKADAHLCVTRALRSDLERTWHIKATVLYDRPPDIYHEISIEEQHQLFQKLKTEYPCFESRDGNQQNTAFTIETDHGVERRPNAPALIISSTSWTDDEDFSILLKALEGYDNLTTMEEHQKTLPKLLCVITGKGPMKDYYAKEINNRSFSAVEFCLPWLTAEDYPKLLASGDIGVSLHTSSSGLDLPMKVVDMFGSGLPVLAIDFNCLSELVRHNQNGLVFRNAQELTQQLLKLLHKYPEHSFYLKAFREQLKAFQAVRWDQSWKDNALLLFR